MKDPFNGMDLTGMVTAPKLALAIGGTAGRAGA